MKKVFFAAVFAVVAVGAAFATSSKKVSATGEFFSVSADTPDIICPAGPQLCSLYYNETAYDKSVNDDTREPVDLSEYEHPIE